MFLYFQSNGCLILAMDRKIQGFKVNVFALSHLPLYILLTYTLMHAESFRWVKLYHKNLGK